MCSALRLICCLGKRWREALDLLVKMEARGLTPDVVTYTTLMCACDRAGEWQVSSFVLSVQARDVLRKFILRLQSDISVVSCVLHCSS